MGLWVSHDAWTGAYSAFDRWRNDIAQAAGYAVWSIKYDDGVHRDTIMIDWGHIYEGHLMGHWEKTPDDPLMVLIAHHDCDGKIFPAQAKPLADRLEELLPKLNKVYPGHIGDIKIKTQKFIDGLRLAVKEDKPIQFG